MARALGNPTTSLPPSRVRYGVLGFACSLSMITYLDRVCMGSAAKSFVQDLGLTSVGDLNWVFAAFTLAYAAVRDPQRLAGRRVRAAQGADPHRALVVGLHGADRPDRHARRRTVLGAFQFGAWAIGPLAVLIGRAVPVRHGRGRGVSEHHPGPAQLVSLARAGLCPRSRVDVRAG